MPALLRSVIGGLAIAAAVVALTTQWLKEACHEHEPVSLISAGRGIFVPDTTKDGYRRIAPTALMVLAIPTWSTKHAMISAGLMILAWSVLNAAVTVLMGEACPGKTDPTIGPGPYAAYIAAIAAAWAMAAGFDVDE
ncbi:MAG: hypothetical protein CL678_15685 [Bdellovibrionaceae bacterium]|nr:hypothetical protein [Pseudobdellovibrionaceae bacterium]|tara:strand:+ start:407 stop:817 length:411 start_codon:yes stop_codon:yes gene_type:complete